MKTMTINFHNFLSKKMIVLICLLCGAISMKASSIDSIKIDTVMHGDTTFLKVYYQFDAGTNFQTDSLYVLVGSTTGSNDILNVGGVINRWSNPCFPNPEYRPALNTYKCFNMSGDTASVVLEIPVPSYSGATSVTVYSSYNGVSKPKKSFFFDLATSVFDLEKSNNVVFRQDKFVIIKFGENSSTAVAKIYDISGRLISSKTFSKVTNGQSFVIDELVMGEGLSLITIQTEKNISKHIIY